MKLDLNDITFVIVTYQSENIVKNCLDSLPKDSKKIIVENSNNINLKKAKSGIILESIEKDIRPV